MNSLLKDITIGHQEDIKKEVISILNTYYRTDKEYILTKYLTHAQNPLTDTNREYLAILKKRYEERTAAMDLLQSINANFFITIAPVSNMPRDMIHDLTNKLLKIVNRELYGRNYFIKGNGHFLEGMAVFENETSNKKRGKLSPKRNTLQHSHYHCFVRTNKSHLEIIRALLKASKAVKRDGKQVFDFVSGIDIQKSDNSDVLLRYCTKESVCADNLFMLTPGGISAEDRYADKYRIIN